MSLDVIRDASLEALKDVVWLEKAIMGLGASQARSYEEFEPNGVGVWQFPSEMAPYLVRLSELKIRSYAEIGLWYGGGFSVTVEYLKRFGLRVALGIDVELRQEAIDYATQTEGVLVMQALSNDDCARYALETLNPDLVFIDGDHSYVTSKHDWELASSCAKYVGFHDIRWLGVKTLWEELDRHKEEFCDEERDGSGTGLVTVK